MAMEINEFIDNVKSQFDDEPASIAADTKFREISGWSSLVALSIISMVDESYDVTLTGDDIRSSATIQDLFDKVLAKA